MLPVDGQPASYLTLAAEGQLRPRAEILRGYLSPCQLCPHRCQVRRLAGERGVCRAGALVEVAVATPHFGEEPILTGPGGVGNIFFRHCQLHCLYCQNYQISQGQDQAFSATPGDAPLSDHRPAVRDREGTVPADREGTVPTPASQDPPRRDLPDEYWEGVSALAETMLDLQNRGVSALGLVSPTHYLPQIVDALVLAVPQGLHLPLIYNTNAYERPEILALLEGIIDIYLPDIKYSSAENARRYSAAPNYPQIARRAIREMYRQVGSQLWADEKGILRRGLIIRHLVLPGGLAGSEETLHWIAEELGTRVTLSLMSQYYPTYRAGLFPPLDRTITPEEYAAVVDLARKLGFRNIFVQEMSSSETYRPDFSDRERPFR